MLEARSSMFQRPEKVPRSSSLSLHFILVSQSIRFQFYNLQTCSKEAIDNFVKFFYLYQFLSYELSFPQQILNLLPITGITSLASQLAPCVLNTYSKCLPELTLAGSFFLSCTAMAVMRKFIPLPHGLVVCWPTFSIF